MLKNKLLIYLADDDDEDRMLFAEALDELKLNVTIQDFDNGVSLMEQLLMTEKPLPGAIFLDLNMPLMNGEECLVDIRNEPNLSQIPIIIFSTYIDDDMLNRLQVLGANFYLMKPSTFRELKNLIGKSLNYVFSNNDTTEKRTEFVIN